MIDDVNELKLIANTLRQDVIRMVTNAKSGHIAGPLGMADIFAALYFNFLKINPKKPYDPKRDYLILSNGHICPVQYAAMAERGFFPVKELMTFRKFGSRLQGHPHRQSLPGIETSSGPLGEGLAQSCGIALALRNDCKPNRVICVMSDGEHEEGSTWEAIMFASKYKLSNLTAIVDRNRIQIDGPTEQIMPLGSLKEKYLAFGWGVLEINGNDMQEALDALSISSHPRERPLAIIAHNVPGKGVSFMENNYEWHGAAPDEEQAENALKELEYTRKILELNR